MTPSVPRRAVVAAALAGVAGVGFIEPVNGYLSQFSPYTGTVWEAAQQEISGDVDSPYGPAEVRYDDDHVPYVTAETEDAGYFAVGYVQAADRLFQMDVQRRVMRGQVSAVFGDLAVETDRFNVQMDYVGAAEATWELIADGPAGDALEAFADGVNAAIENEPLPLEFGLIGYEPAPWTPVDSILMEKQIAWALTGSFETLRRAVVADELGSDVVEDLYSELDHDYPIIREPAGAQQSMQSRVDSTGSVDPDLVGWLSEFESPRFIGSNSWVVSGEHTDSGSPLLANDPHLRLSAPPTWYEFAFDVADVEARGVAFPGVPFVVIGETADVSWGFTNSGVDSIDFYTYDIEGDRYRYGDEWREFDVETKTISVADGEDVDVTVRKTVHGPLIEREGETVGVAWTGLTATETTAAIYDMNHATGFEDALAATERFESPSQNLVYADRDGRTMYYVTGRIPIRTIDGEPVRGDQVFDGSAGHGEWEGFTPYGESTWEGFVPFEENPHVIDPGYLGTANQRIMDDPAHYLGRSFAAPYRGKRVYDRLDAAVESGESIDAAWFQDLQQDTLDGRADQLVPAIVAAAGDEHPSAVAELEAWDHRMDRSSRAALIFARWFEHFREATWSPHFGDLGRRYYPNDWVLATLPEDSRWFVGGRDTVSRDALSTALDELEERGWSTYADFNTTDFPHPFGVGFLRYPSLPTDGSGYTVKNFSANAYTGSSWRMVSTFDGTASSGIIPGGNSGAYFSPHYDDQLERWSNGEYRSLDWVDALEPSVTFGGGQG